MIGFKQWLLEEEVDSWVQWSIQQLLDQGMHPRTLAARLKKLGYPVTPEDIKSVKLTLPAKPKTPKRAAEPAPVIPPQAAEPVIPPDAADQFKQQLRQSVTTVLATAPADQIKQQSPMPVPVMGPAPTAAEKARIASTKVIRSAADLTPEQRKVLLTYENMAKSHNPRDVARKIRTDYGLRIHPDLITIAFGRTASAGPM